MKTYVLTLSKVFPSTHKRRGEPTFFKENMGKSKLHTIRANAGLWTSRFHEIENGEACLSIRQWSGKPYRSPMVEIATLTKDDGIGLQLFNADECSIHSAKRSGERGLFYHHDPRQIAANDGLSYEDWLEWFKGYDKKQLMAIIHFTPFRY